MSKNLLIVESPAKAKTINKYLGKDFTVLASYGHVRDLTPKDGAVDPDDGFAMRYEVIEKNAKHVDAIAKAAKGAEALYLATDLDREGEAISWHIRELLQERGVLTDKPVYRVTFSEITPRAIRDAVAKPREISTDLVNAQQARRALDYLVGFKLSPLLWRKVRAGLSAGRVQSPALRLIVEREEEIERFVKREYWTLKADAIKGDTGFIAKLTHLEGRKLEQFDITEQAAADDVRERLQAAANGELLVADIQRRERRRRPAAPFTTSTLQQEASRKLGFTTRRTMQVAQALYEGIEVDGGMEGLITYMRTDSTHLSNDALLELREMIATHFGTDKLPSEPVEYKTKSKNSQEAHEAIRPTAPKRTPESLRSVLDHDQLRLYELIWKRSVASQMVPAILNVVSVDLACGDEGTFRASGSTVVEPGFLVVYEEGTDQKADDEESGRLPELVKGEWVTLADLRAEQHFTEPPPRYSEASLVKALEEYGIGRPSTYAAIIGTLIAREYVTLDQRRFMPTDVGRVVSKFLSQHFTQYVDYEFTARMEDDLDAVSRGEKSWVPLMDEFWGGFKQQLDDKAESITRAEAASRVLGTDPESGKEVSVRIGRYGPFVQIGTKDDEEKPKFASLRPGQKMDLITLDEALKLFGLPRLLGQHPNGEDITANVGRFGPFVKVGKTYASLTAEDDPYTVTLERALELLAEKEQGAKSRVLKSFEDSDIQVLNGKFGPYITDGRRNVNVPKGSEIEELELIDCEALLDQRGKADAERAKTGAPGAGARAGSGKRRGGRGGGAAGGAGGGGYRSRDSAPPREGGGNDSIGNTVGLAPGGVAPRGRGGGGGGGGGRRRRR